MEFGKYTVLFIMIGGLLFFDGLIYHWQKSIIILTTENVQTYVSQWNGKIISALWLAYTNFLLLAWQLMLFQVKKKTQGTLVATKKY